MTERCNGSRAAWGTPFRVLGIGGSTRPGSSSEKALRIAMHAAQVHGAQVELLTGRSLMLPIYDTESEHRPPEARALLDAVRRSDALIMSSPGYHGTLSGMIKNALDYFEDLRADQRPYLDGMPVGCISVAYGWQATVSTLHAVRVAVHALRGWPSPLGAAVNASVTGLDNQAGCSHDAVRQQLHTVGQQVATFAATQKLAEQSATGQQTPGLSVDG